MKPILTLRDLFWLVLVCGILSAWWAHECWRDNLIKGRIERAFDWPEYVLVHDFLYPNERVEFFRPDAETLVSRITGSDGITVESCWVEQPRDCVTTTRRKAPPPTLP